MKLRLFSALLLAALLPGCVVEQNDPGPVVDSGSLVLDWSIDGSKNPDQCDQSDSSTLDITLTTYPARPRVNSNSRVARSRRPWI